MIFNQNQKKEVFFLFQKKMSESVSFELVFKEANQVIGGEVCRYANMSDCDLVTAWVRENFMYFSFNFDTSEENIQITIDYKDKQLIQNADDLSHDSISTDDGINLSFKNVADLLLRHSDERTFKIVKKRKV